MTPFNASLYSGMSFVSEASIAQAGYRELHKLGKNKGRAAQPQTRSSMRTATG
jgi:hypothetical protein